MASPFFMLYLGLTALRPVVKHIASLALLIILMVPMFYGLTMEWQRGSIRREMKETLEKEMLSSFTLSKEEIRWYEQGKEILIHGNLFDIKKQELLPDGRIRFTGLFDKKETALNHTLNQQQKEQDQKNSRQLSGFFSNWKALPLLVSTNPNVSIPIIYPAPMGQTLPCDPLRTILIPPPQSC